MNTVDPVVSIETFNDYCRKDRYRIELKVKMPYNTYQVNDVLGELGYEVIDADQWGQNYRHRQNYNKTCELDELEYGDELIRLILSEAEVSEQDITDAKERLIAVYENIYKMCRDNIDEYQYPTLLTTELL